MTDDDLSTSIKREELYRECLIDLFLMLSENTIHKIDDYDLIKNKVLMALIRARKIVP